MEQLVQLKGGFFPFLVRLCVRERFKQGILGLFFGPPSVCFL